MQISSAFTGVQAPSPSERATVTTQICFYICKKNEMSISQRENYIGKLKDKRLVKLPLYQMSGPI